MKNHSWRIVLVCVVVSSVSGAGAAWMVAEARYRTAVRELNDVIGPAAKEFGVKSAPNPATIREVLEPFLKPIGKLNGPL